MHHGKRVSGVEIDYQPNQKGPGGFCPVFLYFFENGSAPA
ncbi:hypothetical protein J2S25_002139 [Mesobacillus stamsii]|uniref:Uncharacterized protein n=1 Tax=Mesobacillus stamsii TaxID=225347 RepID=A0ABU0FX61_9BACI|nr:hypothetical protein [Mesobacillus stamsii]